MFQENSSYKSSNCICLIHTNSAANFLRLNTLGGKEVHSEVERQLLEPSIVCNRQSSFTSAHRSKTLLSHTCIWKQCEFLGPFCCWCFVSLPLLKESSIWIFHFLGIHIAVCGFSINSKRHKMLYNANLISSVFFQHPLQILVPIFSFPPTSSTNCWSSCNWVLSAW
jgi:hypothetical protein